MTHTSPTRPFLKALTALAVVAAMASPSWAAHMTDYDTVDEGAAINAFLTTDFFSSSSSGPVVDTGDLTGRVYENAGVYTYEMTVTAGVDNVSEFNTQFAVAGFNGVAGWSFTDAAAAGGPGDSTAFTTTVDADGTIDFNTTSGFFDAGESITFFFQSTIPPAELLGYALINGRVGETLNYAPGREGPGQVIPVPAALPAGLVLLGLSGMFRRRLA